MGRSRQLEEFFNFSRAVEPRRVGLPVIDPNMIPKSADIGRARSVWPIADVKPNPGPPFTGSPKYASGGVVSAKPYLGVVGDKPYLRGMDPVSAERRAQVHRSTADTTVWEFSPESGERLKGEGISFTADARAARREVPATYKPESTSYGHGGMIPDPEPKNDMLHMVEERSGMKWAQEFCKLNPASDEGVMLAWFCSAIEAGAADERKRIEKQAVDKKARDGVREILLRELRSTEQIGGFFVVRRRRVGC